MLSTPVLEYLKQHGQCLDSEIAEAMGISLPDVRKLLAEMSAKGSVMRCKVTRFHNGEPVEETLSRVAGFIPRPAPGRKPLPKK